MYNNIGKRDLLIFPKFDNIDIINKVRDKYDKLADLVNPHITIAFSFNDEISNNDLINRLSSLLENYSPFKGVYQSITIFY